jgi:alginate O-acetyltransferase complex protein AlgI
MLFCTLPFVGFFALVFAAYWAVPWQRARVWLLLAASFYFYASWNPWLAWIVCVTSALDYLFARGMDVTAGPFRRRLLLYASLAMNLGLLGYFKYANFFLRSMEATVRAAGGEASLPVLNVILPIGLSFYTFEAINYTVDVYRRRMPAERNLAHFMLFILFFPHLIAGPIVRAKDFLPQINRRKRWDWPRLHLGIQYCLLGVFKKLAIADRMAQFADPIFNAPDQYNTGATWLAVIAYTLQIYCDFSGYSDLALGTAHMLGYKLTVNFNMPYLSTNVSDFWRRWHISLSDWLRDYVFMPLTFRGPRRSAVKPGRLRAALSLLTGGTRGSRYRMYYALIVTMTACGLWHGASWTFVASGFMFGVLMVCHRMFEKFCATRPRLTAALLSAPGTFVRWTMTYLCVCVVWTTFRASSFAAAGTMYYRMIVPHAGRGVPLPNMSLWYTVAIVAAAHAVVSLGLWPRLAIRLPAPIRGFGFAAAFSLALVLAPETDKAFIYFQF